jgi:hypothetical protein
LRRNRSLEGKTALQKQQELLRYLLAAEPVLNSEWGYTDVSSIQLCKAGQSDLWEEAGGQVWDEPPTQTHLGLTDNQIRE